MADRPRETSARAIGAGVVAAVAVAAATWGLVAPGCTTSSCDGAVYELGRPPNVQPAPDTFVELPALSWFRLDEHTFATSAVETKWLDYPAQRTYILWPPSGASGFPELTAYIAPQDEEQTTTPNTENFTVGSGNAAEFKFLGSDGSFQVHNDTCAHFQVRVVARFPTIASAPPVDAGPDPGDASTDTDTPVDAAQDGPIKARSE